MSSVFQWLVFCDNHCIKIMLKGIVLIGFGFHFRHFYTDSLTCDCNLKWVLHWARNASVRISEETVCAFPRSLQGTSFQNLKENQLMCGEWYSSFSVMNWNQCSQRKCILKDKCQVIGVQNWMIAERKQICQKPYWGLRLNNVQLKKTKNKIRLQISFVYK